MLVVLVLRQHQLFIFPDLDQVEIMPFFQIEPTSYRATPLRSAHHLFVRHAHAYALPCFLTELEIFPIGSGAHLLSAYVL
eukprot:COSAG02_NODE_5511_length_4270_cov_25.261158_2_plen_80_part_00